MLVDDCGWECDEYDLLNFLYVIWENVDGMYGGLMWFLLIIGLMMVNDYFFDLIGGGVIISFVIWECMWFCFSWIVESCVVVVLMLVGGELMCKFVFKYFVGVFDVCMICIYWMIGLLFDVLGSSGDGCEIISIGLWDYSLVVCVCVFVWVGLFSMIFEYWFICVFG